MTDGIMAELSNRYHINHENLLELVGGLTDEQITWTPNETTPSVGFHVWHLARWADYLQELINGRGSQSWEIEGLAARWNMDGITWMTHDNRHLGMIECLVGLQGQSGSADA